MAVKVRVLFEVMGWPKEALNSSLKQTLDVLKQNNWKILKEEYAEPTPLVNPEKPVESENPDFSEAETKKMVELQAIQDPEFKEELKKGKMFSSFVEFEGEVETLLDLFGFAINFAPSVIEILEPYDFDISAGEMQDMIADVCGKVRIMDKDIKMLAAENKIMREMLQKYASVKKPDSGSD